MLEHKGDFEMSVPFGTIRGKIWHQNDRVIDDTTKRVLGKWILIGLGTNVPILLSLLVRFSWEALHGWQDNCGTFDTLIPLLPENLYVVAIDFPGHGLSSHMPPGCPYNDTIFVIEVERVIQHLGWKDKSFTILGHSMGAAIGMFYACLYPKAVECLISLDMIKPLTFPSEKLASKTREGIEQFLHLESKISGSKSNSNVADKIDSTIPMYEHKEALAKLITAHSVFGKITMEGAEILLKRGCKPSPDDPNKVYFTRDNRLKAILFQRMDNEALIHYFDQLHCELLIIKAQAGVKLDPEEISNRYIEVYRQKCPRFEYIVVPGGHHVHLCNPENVHQKIIDFLTNSKLMSNGSV